MLMATCPNEVRKLSKIKLVVLTAAVLVGAAAAFYGYALRHWRLAERAMAQGRWNEADDSLRLCLKVWPLSAGVHLAAARTARSVGDFTRAERLLNRCTQLTGGPTEAIQPLLLLAEQ